MKKHLLYIAGSTPALCYASHFLQCHGCNLITAPNADVTHLLLPVPSFQPDGQLAGGDNLDTILSKLPKDITIMGGNLSKPLLEKYPTIDLLEHEGYLAHNAAITAECALRIAVKELPCSLCGCQILILGWGRIGKCLSKLLRTAGAAVTVAARKEADRAMAEALGYTAIDYSCLEDHLQKFRIVFSTVPFMVLSDIHTAHCHPDCVKIDLASVSSIGGSGVIWARGLPGKMMPEESGFLIAKTVLAHLSDKEDII